VCIVIYFRSAIRCQNYCTTLATSWLTVHILRMFVKALGLCVFRLRDSLPSAQGWFTEAKPLYLTNTQDDPTYQTVTTSTDSEREGAWLKLAREHVYTTILDDRVCCASKELIATL